MRKNPSLGNERVRSSLESLARERLRVGLNEINVRNLKGNISEEELSEILSGVRTALDIFLEKNLLDLKAYVNEGYVHAASVSQGKFNEKDGKEKLSRYIFYASQYLGYLERNWFFNARGESLGYRIRSDRLDELKQLLGK